MDPEAAAAGAEVTRRPADLLEEDEMTGRSARGGRDQTGAAAVRTDQAVANWP
jgi:hypothetical protein